jgi:hypothetical protein
MQSGRFAVLGGVIFVCGVGLGSAFSLFLAIRYMGGMHSDNTIPFRVAVYNDDCNGDGVTDLLTVQVMHEDRQELWYARADADFDGTIDEAMLELGNKRVMVTPFDDDGDGMPERLGLALKNGANRWVNYQDYNCDGILDAKSIVREPGPLAIEKWILLDECWTSVTSVDRIDGRWEAQLSIREEPEQMAVFEDSRWTAN